MWSDLNITYDCRQALSNLITQIIYLFIYLCYFVKVQGGECKWTLGFSNRLYMDHKLIFASVCPKHCLFFTLLITGVLLKSCTWCKQSLFFNKH